MIFENLSLNSKSIIWAHEKGFRLENSKIFSPSGKELTLKSNWKGYLYFCFRPKVSQAGGRKICNICVHRFTAYIKYGNSLFEKGIVVRHLDGNCKNNSFENLALGSHYDNYMDQTEEVRKKRLSLLSFNHKKFTNEEIALIRQDHLINKLSYRDIMKKWGIPSTGSVGYILKHTYKT